MKLTRRQLKRIILEGLMEDLVDSMVRSGVPPQHWRKMAGTLSYRGMLLNQDAIALDDAITIYEEWREKHWNASTKNIWEKE